MTNDAQKIAEVIQGVTEGLDLIDVVPLPPKVAWGEEFLAWDDQKKISYLTKFAEAMNHAASQVQTERDQLATLCKQKENQIESMKVALNQNNELLQQEITRMNADRQQYNAAIAELKAELRATE